MVIVIVHSSIYDSSLELVWGPDPLQQGRVWQHAYNIHVPIMATFLIFFNKSFPFHFLMVIEEGLSVTLGAIFIMI